MSRLRERLALVLRGAVDALVDLGGRRPGLVLACGLAVMIAAWGYASRLDVRSDVVELLPRDSPGFQSFERHVDRLGGRATILVVVESPDRAANERFVDAAKAAVLAMPDAPRLVSSIEADTKDVRAFYEEHEWLYAKLADLEDADAKLDRQIALRSGMVEDLLDDKPEPALGADALHDRFEREARSRDEFPSGYFASDDGTQLVMRIFSTTSGLGGGRDEHLLARVERAIAALHPERFHPAMKVGYGGDIPNTAAEKESLVHEAVTATAIAGALILAGVIWFYGSPWSLVLVGFPPLFGVGCAYAFATARYGYVNASGAFLGAIVLGNGVNYPIVLYSRYKEFRARGMPPDVARRDAVWNAFRAELVGASVASIAYGSLTITRFRGFSQFGVIGFVGMLLVWLSMIPCLPALIVLVERLQRKVPPWLRERPARVAADGSRGPFARLVGDLTERHPRLLVAFAAALALVAASRLPAFLRDPWEYDFDKLGSEGARKSGAYHWSAVADRVLAHGTHLSGSLVLVDRPDQVDAVEARILANDAADPDGPLIEGVTTIDDFLPGSPELQAKKLEVLARIRDRLSPGVLARLEGDERAKVLRLMPPGDLAPIRPSDLPALVRSRFSEKNGTLGTVMYVRYRPDVSRNDGHNLLRMSRTIDGVVLDDGTHVDTASRATVFAEMIRSLERDGPLATAASFAAVCVVLVVATASLRGAFAVVLALVMGVTLMLGGVAFIGERLNFLNFIALPITFGIGSEYPFNIFDRSRLLGGDVTRAVKLHAGAVTLCSYTTTIGYASLLFADNQALRSFGRLAITGELTCLFVAIVFLPSLLHVMRFTPRVRRFEAIAQPSR